jgi:ABC-type sulfate/molybdate transport systems ATPase subunit
VDELLNLLQIAAFRERMPRTLSGGQAQRVALARALALDTEILLLDEPFSSLDHTVADISCELIRTVHERRGLTTILVTHDRHYALSLATRIVVLSPLGRILEDGPPQTVYDQPRSLAGARMTGRLVELAGKVLGLENGKVRIATLGTEMVGLSAAESLQGGQQVIAAVRPERFEVFTGPADNAFCCRISGPGPIDQPYDLICTASDGTRFTATVGLPGTQYTAGHELTLRVDPTDLHCFPTSEGA